MNRPKSQPIDRRLAIKRIGFSGLGIGIGCCGCKTAPVTNRPQLMIMPEQKEIALGLEAFQDTLKTESRSTNRRLVDIVNRVGQRIAAVSDRNDYAWEFQLIASPTQNAFCLPGGKVAIYEGILPVCEDEAGLAVVMSHEIAHALARHGGERMSHSMAVDGAKMFAEKLAGQYAPEKKEILMQAYGVGTKYGVILPYNRRQESEADHIGIMLMAQAGYDPAAAPSFWTRFGQAKGSQQAEFFSTHPNDERRAADLQESLTQANEYYLTAQQKHGRGEPLG